MQNRFAMLIVLALVVGSLSSCSFIGGSESGFAGTGGGEAASPVVPGEPAPDDPGSGAGASAEGNALWVATEGNDAASGSVDQPLQTVRQAVSLSAAEGGAREVRLVAGEYAEDVALGDAGGYFGIRISGGYGPLDAAGTSRARDPAAFVARVRSLAVDGSFGNRSGGREAVIDGVSLGRLSIVNASPSVSGSAISTAGMPCASGAPLTVRARSGASIAPTISDSAIGNASCLYGGSVPAILGVELISENGSSLVASFERSAIAAGSADNAAGADVVIGLRGRAERNAVLEVALTGSEVSSGAALLAADGVNVFADAGSQASLAASGSSIAGGSGETAVCYAIDLGFDPAQSAYASFSGADLAGNRIFGGSGCDLSGGIYAAQAGGAVSLRNNFIHGGTNAVYAQGVALDVADALIVHNTIFAEAVFQATLVDLVSSNAGTRIERNILAASAPAAIGIAEAFDSTPLSVAENLFDPALSVAYSSNDAAHPFGDLLTVADLAAAYPSFASNLEGPAQLANPAGLDLHLAADSAAVDAVSVDPSTPLDIDGDSRPLGAAAEIGADELIP